MKNQVFIPAFAKSSDDLKLSWDIQSPLKQAGYNRGFLLVIKKGIQGVTVDRDIQYHNLELYAKDYGDAPILIMMSYYPVVELDFFRNKDFAKNHVREGIAFAKNLPLGGKKVLSFHLHSLFPEEEFLGTREEEWRERFRLEFLPLLCELNEIGKASGVTLQIETVPVPEGGDNPSLANRGYLGLPVSRLRNPFYLTHLWGFKELHEAGLGVWLDICHNSTIYAAARDGDPDTLLHPGHRAILERHSLMDDVHALSPSDLIHLNDGSGYLSDKQGTSFKEGLACGEGAIKELPEIISFINSHHIPFAIEVWDADFMIRKETRRSIDYLIRYSK